MQSQFARRPTKLVARVRRTRDQVCIRRRDQLEVVLGQGQAEFAFHADGQVDLSRFNKSGHQRQPFALPGLCNQSRR